MNKQEFLDKLDDFDFDSFGKDNSFDNSDAYAVVRFFSEKIYNDIEKRVCENCKHFQPFARNEKYYRRCFFFGSINLKYCSEWESK